MEPDCGKCYCRDCVSPYCAVCVGCRLGYDYGNRSDCYFKEVAC